MIRISTFFLLVCVLGLGQPAAQGAEDWMTLEGEFVDSLYYDGDSFSLRTRKKDGKRTYTYIFRLYGVDCPETNDSQDPARVTEQAKHFRLPESAVLRWGQTASDFTARTLREARNITVVTRKSKALGQSRKNRYYAFVKVDGRDLAEMLVENGLARSHGVSAAHDGLSSDGYQRLLDRKERTAKRNRAGLWQESDLPR